VAGPDGPTRISVAARRPSRAETERAARHACDEPPRVPLRREIRIAAGGAGTEREFFARLERAGVLVRWRFGPNDDLVTGYAVGLPQHVTTDGDVI
jgi:hypothetical protein